MICPIAEDVWSDPLTKQVYEEGFRHKVTLFPSVFSMYFMGRSLINLKEKKEKKLYKYLVLHQTSPCIYLFI